MGTPPMTALADRARQLPQSRLHDERTAAILGIALGLLVGVCFATGLLSHLIQHPPSWFSWPSRPAGLYRVTQGVHVATGLALVPIVLAKLWVVGPKLLQWPPFHGVAQTVERLMLVPLVGGVIFEIVTGIANLSRWYPWPFTFRSGHYAVAWITIGALIVHLVAKWAIVRRSLGSATDRPLTAAPAPATFSSIDRRSFLGAVFGASGLLTLLTLGQTAAPLERLALLVPRRPSTGPQGFPVNTSAVAAGVVDSARDPSYRLVVDGAVERRLSLSVDDLRALPQREATLPIACVEGWSASVTWRGVQVRELLDRAGAGADAEVTVHSLERGRSPSARSDLNVDHAHDVDTLLALDVGGEPLHLDHGAPARLIGPNRPGTLQTKWVERLEVR
jgi:DMSO/TMAO reductase YedYZ molybdopterin-dependent catalytic subunit